MRVKQFFYKSPADKSVKGFQFLGNKKKPVQWKIIITWTWAACWTSPALCIPKHIVEIWEHKTKKLFSLADPDPVLFLPMDPGPEWVFFRITDLEFGIQPIFFESLVIISGLKIQKYLCLLTQIFFCTWSNLIIFNFVKFMAIKR